MSEYSAHEEEIDLAGSAQSLADLDDAMQVLTFRLGGEIFAFDINKVREVLDLTKVRKVPQTPDFMKGVINLRGNVVPVFDLRLKFGMPAADATVDSCIIIVEVLFDGDEAVFGALADSVNEVVTFPKSMLEPAPKMGTMLRTDFIKSMGKHNDHFAMILDIDRVFKLDDGVFGDSSD